MNLKKLLVVSVALLTGTFAFALPKLDEPETNLLQQYMAQVEKMQQQFDTQLLPPLQTLAQLGLQLQASDQEILTEEQSAQLELVSGKIDRALQEMVEPIVKQMDMAQFNQNYRQQLQALGQPAPEKDLTQQDVTDMFKTIYLLTALAHFEQTKKLSAEELQILTAIFLPQEDEGAN